MLICELDKVDEEWRAKYLLVMDNASIHRSKVTQGFFERHGVPVLYTGSRGFEPHYGYLFGYRSQSSVSSVG